ncbi:MAG: hypothetical protein HZC44_13765 [Geobacter sp.]|nr:hypothetical protein [Geobacter sp.]
MKCARLVLLVGVLCCCAWTMPAWGLEVPGGPDHPLLSGGDRRPHIPRMLDKFGPMTLSLADLLEKRPEGATAVEVAQLLREMGQELHDMYALSMSVTQTTAEADELFRQVQETEKKIKALRERL